jgi:hypothetical protein
MNEIPALVRELYRITDQLERLVGRPFTPDGHLVGSLGEAYAAHLFDLTLMRPSTAGFDARSVDGRSIEIKATQRRSIAISASGDIPDHLIVLSISSEGVPTVEYNGRAESVWAQAGRPQKNGQRQISLTKLRNLMVDTPIAEQLPQVRSIT